MAGPSMRDRFQLVVVRPIAVKISRSGTSSGTMAWRAGMDSASTVPLKKPNQMKSQKSTWPAKMMTPSRIVATLFKPWASMMMPRLGTRSAMTPPRRAKATNGIMNDSVTQARSRAEDVSV